MCCSTHPARNLSHVGSGATTLAAPANSCKKQQSIGPAPHVDNTESAMDRRGASPSPGLLGSRGNQSTPQPSPLLGADLDLDVIWGQQRSQLQGQVQQVSNVILIKRQQLGALQASFVGRYSRRSDMTQPVVSQCTSRECCLHGDLQHAACPFCSHAACWSSSAPSEARGPCPAPHHSLPGTCPTCTHTRISPGRTIPCNS